MALSIKSIALIGGSGALTLTVVAFVANYLSKGKQMLLAKGKQLINIEEGYDTLFYVFRKDKELIKEL